MVIRFLSLARRRVCELLSGGRGLVPRGRVHLVSGAYRASRRPAQKCSSTYLYGYFGSLYPCGFCRLGSLTGLRGTSSYGIRSSRCLIRLSRALLVVGTHDEPGREAGVRRGEHLVACARIIEPAAVRLEVHVAQLPGLAVVVDALLEPTRLFVRCDLEPVLEQAHAGIDDCLLDQRDRLEELLGLLLGAEPHDALDAGAVVPAAVEDHDFAGGRQVGQVSLQVHLAALTPGRCRQRNDAKDARTDALREGLDRAALAGPIAALEDDDDLCASRLDPALELHELAVQLRELLFVVLARELAGRGPVAAYAAGAVGATRGFRGCVMPGAALPALVLSLILRSVHVRLSVGRLRRLPADRLALPGVGPPTEPAPCRFALRKCVLVHECAHFIRDHGHAVHVPETDLQQSLVPDGHQECHRLPELAGSLVRMRSCKRSESRSTRARQATRQRGPGVSGHGVRPRQFLLANPDEIPTFRRRLGRAGCCNITQDDREVISVPMG